MIKSVLLIDNYDSFTFNIKDYIECLGHKVLLIKNDDSRLDNLASLGCSHIVLSPGPGSPNDAGKSLQVILNHYQDYPMLGVCLGHQCLVQAFSGRVTRAARVMHGKVSVMHNSGKSLFKNMPQAFNIARYHSLIAEKATLPDCFDVLGWVAAACRGDDEVMAIRHKNHPLFGVQYHPEALLSEHGLALFAAFFREAPVVNNRRAY